MRYFVGIELEAPLKEQLLALQEKLRADFPTVTWLNAEQLFLTVRFLGNVRATLGLAKKSLRRMGAHIAPFSLSLSAMGCFPETDPVRTIWVGVSDPTDMLSRLERECEELFSRVGAVGEERSFVPHIPIGRIPTKIPKGPLRKKVIQLHPETLTEAVKEICLVQSRLTQDGAAYQVIFRVPLTASIVS